MFGSIPDVVIPQMYSELTSRRVLVVVWVEVCPFFIRSGLERVSDFDLSFLILSTVSWMRISSAFFFLLPMRRWKNESDQEIQMC
jgi:hypothetical protein